MSNFFRRKRTQQTTSESGEKIAPKRRGPLPITDENALYEHAVASLLRHMRTAAELKRSLRKRLEPGAEGLAMLDRVIERLKARQYLSDARYAASFSTQRKEGRKLGARRVAQDLRNKGVASDVISREVEVAYQGTDEETQARAFLAKKRTAQPANGDEKARARICRQLARAGFSPRTAFHILRNWEAPNPS